MKIIKVKTDLKKWAVGGESPAFVPTKVRQALKPPENLTVSQWAEKNRMLVGQTSAEPGPWRNGRTPYLVGIMDALNDRHVETIVFCKGSQIGGTEAIYNQLGFAIDQDPAPAMIVMPTLDLARSISGSRIQPMIDSSPTLRAKKPRDLDDFSLQEMKFPGMVLNLSGANSPASLASRPVRYLWLDEVDKYPTFAGKEADPISLATERQKTFWNRKTVILSTPTTEDGHIWKSLNRCDEIREYHVPCHHCGEIQPLLFENIKWPDSIDKTSGDYTRRIKETAWYECRSCGQKIDDRHRPEMLQAGQWLPRSAHKGIVRSIGFHLSSLYSPWLRWGDVAEKFIQSKPYPETLQNFVNSWLAEPWKNVINQGNADEIAAAKLPGQRLQIVPQEAAALVATIDVQKAGFWFVVRAWSRDFTSWLVDCGFLPDWEYVENMLFSGMYGRPIWRGLIDIGGGERYGSDISSTEEVEIWLRRNGRGRGPHIWGCKGSSSSLAGKLSIGKPLDKTPSGKPLHGGLQIISLDTGKLKDVFWWRTSQAKERAVGSAYLPEDIAEEYARQIMAEEKRRDRHGREEWHRIRKDNHLLDCEMMQMAAVDPELFGGLTSLGRWSGISSSNSSQAPEKPLPAGPTGPNPYL